MPVPPSNVRASTPTEVEPISLAPPPLLLATVGDAALLGARTAGTGSGSGAGSGTGTNATGPGSGACDMVGRLQQALRQRPDIRAAVARVRDQAQGRAVLLWDGDWRQTPGQDGKGLAGVRQAVALEVAFAPAECRAEPMRGLVLIHLSDAPAADRLALGRAVWRWSDLLR